jgi:hypothetical protein
VTDQAINLRVKHSGFTGQAGGVNIRVKQEKRESVRLTASGSMSALGLYMLN